MTTILDPQTSDTMKYEIKDEFEKMEPFTPQERYEIRKLLAHLRLLRWIEKD